MPSMETSSTSSSASAQLGFQRLWAAGFRGDLGDVNGRDTLAHGALPSCADVDNECGGTISVTR